MRCDSFKKDVEAFQSAYPFHKQKVFSTHIFQNYFFNAWGINLSFNDFIFLNCFFKNK